MNKEEFINDILKKKKETGVRILAHIYQPPEILELADVVGDSFKLAEMAQVMGDTVIVCGVRFMAETVKILSPNKKVILASPEATCPMAEQITPEYIRKFKKKNPDVAVCAYINTTAELKEEADVCVTSSSAVKICKNIENDKILFIPDKNLGSYVAKAVPEKKFALVDGFCPIHNQLTAADVLVLKQEHPLALFAVHPEAPAEVVALADYVGATSGIIDYCKKNPNREIIIGTECGVYDYLTLRYPKRKFYQLAPEKMVCKDMKYTGLTALWGAISGQSGEVIEIPEENRLRAKKSIDEMLRLGKK
ncbi:MAG: quinolinate synthase NadA [Clostridia bacterium]|nr:quinolinate synthase NadA [Clostridia bacterium]